MNKPTRHPDAIIGAIRECAENGVRRGSSEIYCERIANDLLPELQAALLQQRLEDSLKYRNAISDAVAAVIEAQS